MIIGPVTAATGIFLSQKKEFTARIAGNGNTGINMNIREYIYLLMILVMIFFMCLADYERRQEMISVFRQGQVIYNLHVTGKYPTTNTFPEGFDVAEGENAGTNK